MKFKWAAIAGVFVSLVVLGTGCSKNDEKLAYLKEKEAADTRAGSSPASDRNSTCTTGCATATRGSFRGASASSPAVRASRRIYRAKKPSSILTKEWLGFFFL